MREIISEMYFDSRPPKSLAETGARIQAIAKERGIPAEKLEEELCGWIADEMGNVVD